MMRTGRRSATVAAATAVAAACGSVVVVTAASSASDLGSSPAAFASVRYRLAVAASASAASRGRRNDALLPSSSTSSALRVYYVDTAEDAPRDVQSMEEWSALCGAQTCEGFQLTTEDGGYDYGVTTTADIPAETAALFVPESMILSYDKAIAEFGKLDEAERFLRGLNAADEIKRYYLVAKILYEWERGDESPWFPWLNSLPRYFTNGASMTEFCFECLPPLAASLAVKERTNLMGLSNVDKVPFLSDETKNDGPLCKWAFQIAYTRAFEAEDGSGDLRIVPLADMFNHAADEEIRLTYDDEGNCYACTTRDVPAGSPLRMSYGDPTNPSKLFARYGFLDESTAATFCKIMIPHVDSKLEDMGYAHDRMLFYTDTGDVSEEVWDVLLYQLLGSTNAAQKRQFYVAHMNGEEEIKRQFHDSYWTETSAKLLDHIDGFLDQLDKLSAKAEGRDVSQHPRLPLIMAHNDFVRNTFLAVRSKYFGERDAFQ